MGKGSVFRESTNAWEEEFFTASGGFGGSPPRKIFKIDVFFVLDVENPGKKILVVVVLLLLLLPLPLLPLLPLLLLLPLLPPLPPPPSRQRPRGRPMARSCLGKPIGASPEG